MSARLDLGVYPLRGEPGRYHVRSSIRRNLLYLVDLDALVSGWCGCAHFEYRVGLQLVPEVECKHIRLARTYLRLQRQFAERRRRARP